LCLKRALLGMGVDAVYAARYDEKMYLPGGLTEEAFAPFYSMPSSATAIDLGMMVRDPTQHVMFSIAYPDDYGVRRFAAGAIAPAEWGEISFRILPLVPSLQGADWPWVAGSIEIRRGADRREGCTNRFGNSVGKWIMLYPNDHHRHRAITAAQFEYPMTMGALRQSRDELLHLTNALLDQQQTSGTYGTRMECRTRAAGIERPMTLLEVAKRSYHDLEWVDSLITAGILRLKYIGVAQWRRVVQLGWQRCHELNTFGGMRCDQPKKDCRGDEWRRFAGKREEFLWLTADLMVGSGRYVRDALRAMRFKFDTQPSESFGSSFDPMDIFYQSGGPGVAPVVAGSRADQLCSGQRKDFDACSLMSGDGAENAAARLVADVAADDGAGGGDAGAGRESGAQPRARSRAGAARQPMDRDELDEDVRAIYDALPVKKLKGDKYAAYYLPAYAELRGMAHSKRPKTHGFVSHASLSLHIWRELGAEWAQYVENVHARHPGARRGISNAAPALPPRRVVRTLIGKQPLPPH
jgi:hypothetical protein